ncbi:hypothetical protein P4S83_18325 [Aneurinibacillus thermoaerophilus]|uniref:hypothetical protein n=1 Tax=Aneurinibacillus thermoaerophilus TaxID=143495 RepID=UPI002E2354A4|nr:hypothetical protein [Aneurinibacillus thermoaerophilus]MED0766157.1 hypothetical protein [Aneurinibacillus thermoaerophilus]
MSEVTKTKKTISVLVIEDEDTQIQTMQDAFDDFNNESMEYTINADMKKNLNDSLVSLISNDYDVAIVDLNLDQTVVDEARLGGIQIIDIIVKKLRVPVIVRTGYPGKFDTSNPSFHSPFVKVYSKDAQVEEIIKNIIDWYSTGITTTLGTKGTLQNYLNILFWEQISHNINEWNSHGSSHEEHEKPLMRYTLNVLQNLLEIDSTTGGFENFHPAEVYIKPPIRQDLFFGDILKAADDKYFIILTPSCEMAQKKYQKILLAEIISHDSVAGFADAKSKYSTNLSKSKKDSLAKWLRNGHADSIGYHFLPPYSDFPGGFVDFQSVFSINPQEEEFNHIYEKIATVSGQFAKDISSRFTLYYARQGQPNLNSDLIIDTMITELSLQK